MRTPELMSDDDLQTQVQEKALIRGEFLLRSGQTSDRYFDKYRFESDPKLLSRICEEMKTLVPPNVDGLAGLELGGIPIVTLLAQKMSLPAYFVRKKRKPYGTRNVVEGGNVKGLNLAVVDDVLTTGGQLLSSVRDLRGEGALISDVIIVIDRVQGGAENLAKEALTLRALFSFPDM